MKIFVTGATGLIGYHLTRELAGKRHQVKALVRRTSDVSFLNSLKVAQTKGDVLSLSSLKRAFKDCQIVFHAAGKFSYWGYNRQDFIEEAQTGMKNVIRAAAANKIRRVVFTSSSVTLGYSETPHALTENKKGILNGHDQPAYVAAKIAQEKTAFEEGLKLGVEVVALCPTISVGGPDTHLTESNRMIVNYLKDDWKSSWIGGCNIVHASDVAKGMVIAAKRGRSGESYLCGSDNLTWHDAHKLVSELSGLGGPYIQAFRTSAYLISTLQELQSAFTRQAPSASRDQARMVGNYYWYDSSKLQALGYNPMSSENALIEAVSWLVASDHIPPSLRASMKLSERIYDLRKRNLRQH